MTTIASIDPRQGGLRRQIIVPDIVMHGLERPDQFAGLAFERATELACSSLPKRLPPQKSGLGDVVGRNRSPLSSSTDIGAQTLLWPASMPSCTSGSNVQRGCPVLSIE